MKDDAKNLIGAAGEHYVMSQLLQRGFIGALAPTGSPTIDILVSSLTGDPLATIQVKTRRSVDLVPSWPMNRKHENASSKRLFYCFVNFFTDPKKMPQVFVVPSKTVAELIHVSHATWRNGKKINGEDRKDTPMRSLSRKHTNLKDLTPSNYSDGWLDEYENAWGLLEIDGN
ncbi:MAG: hypothetical protein ACOH2M_05015 [Cypionkella sp.]